MNKNNILSVIMSLLGFAVLAGLAFVGFFTALFLIPIVLALGAFFIWRTKRKMKNMYMNENSSYVYVRSFADNNMTNTQEKNDENIIEISAKDYTIIDSVDDSKSDKFSQ